MASPQKENGYTGFSNELLEAIMQHPFTGQELKVVLKIARETYGWSRKKAQVSYGEIARSTGISRRNVIRVCKVLVTGQILFFQETSGERSANVMGINKNYEDWNAGRCGVLSGEDSVLGDTIPINDSGSEATRLVAGIPLAKGSTGDNGATRHGDTGATTSKQVNNTLKKAGKQGRLINNPENKTHEKVKQVASLLDGLEGCIADGVDPTPLIDRFVGAGFDLKKTWGTLIQARQAGKKPAGFFVKALANPAFAVADSAMEMVSGEMRQYNY